MTWALRRKIIYVSILVAFFSGIALLVGYPYLNKPPTCFDGKHNGDEAATDCGGSCALACAFEVDNLSVIWSRAFEVVPGRYNAVAYLENQNINTAIYSIKYRFRFADANNVYVGKREGEIFIPPAGKFAIFEQAVDMGNSVPVYTTFEFAEAPVWVNVPKETTDALKLTTSDIKLVDAEFAPKLSATLTNNSLYLIPDLSVVAILYDVLGNVISSSRTYMEILRAEEVKTINFSWPEPFGEEVVNIELIPMYNIFLTRLK